MTRWSVLVVTPTRAWPVELAPGRGLLVGQGRGCALALADVGLSARHLVLVARPEGVAFEVVGGAGEVRLNDIPVTGLGVARAGDELRLGDARLVCVGVPAQTPARPRLAAHDEFMSRLEDEVARAGAARPVGLALVLAPSLTVAARQAQTRRVMDEVLRSGLVPCFGELAPDVLGVLLPEAGAAALDALAVRLPVVAGARASVAVARSPEDGLEAEAVVGRAWRRLLGDALGASEPVWVDPVMVRLAGVMEALGHGEGPVLAVGPPGSGRQTLLEVAARAAGRRVVAVSAADAAGVERAVAGRTGEWLLLRDVHALTEAQLEAVAGRTRSRLLATAVHRPGADVFDAVVEVPPLAARPDDVQALAEHFLARARQATGRPRLALGSEARALLAGWRWPGNVRELENLLLRAARVSVRDEVGRDALPARLAAGAPAADFRGAMRAAERELLLETLARTRWNVTAAAARLGMPRRTVVHRMAKLGLKRPAR